MLEIIVTVKIFIYSFIVHLFPIIFRSSKKKKKKKKKKNKLKYRM